MLGGAVPVTILSSDLAYADVDDGRLALRYRGDREPVGYVLVLDGAGGTRRELAGPFEHEDEALQDAARRFGALDWSAH